MGDIKHRIGIGCLGDDITISTPPTLLPAFTADTTLIFADTTIRTADETN